ncbi:MAG: GldG family protein [Pseudobdellovibrionaceae bacterium]
MTKAGRILLVLAAVGLLSTGVARLILGVWMPFMWILLGISVLFLLVSITTERKVLLEFFSTKTTKQGMSLGVAFLLVLLILAAVNYIGARHYKTFDLSEAQLNTLSDQSLKLMGQLQEDLKVTFFYQKGAEGVEETRRAFIDLLKKYQDVSAKVKLDFIDINERPAKAEEYGVTKGSGLVFVEYQGRKNKIERVDEQELTAAIANVLRTKDVTVYFTLGHGERNTSDEKEVTGLASLKKMLEGNRYVVREVNLMTTGAVPPDAEILVVAGPQQKFLDSEISALEAFLRRGGRMIVAWEMGSQSNLEGFLSRFGLSVDTGLIAQVMNTPLGQAVNPSVTPASGFSSHAITRVFGQGQFIVTRLPQPVRVSAKLPEGITIDEMVKTDVNSMLFANTQFSQSLGKGPFTVAALAEGQLPQAEKDFQLLLLGDSDLLGNQLLYQNLNRDLVLNIFSYLSSQNEMISISPKEISKTEFVMTETSFMVFLFGFLIPLPVVFLGLAGWLWYRRRYA